MLLSYSTKQTERRGTSSKNFGKLSAQAGKKLATNVIKNRARALECRGKICSAAAAV